MSTFEIIIVFMLTNTFLAAVIYFALHVKVKPKDPPQINFPEAFTLKMLQEMPTSTVKKELSAEDKEFLKEREAKAKEMTEEYLDMSSTANGILDEMMGEKKK